MAEWSQLPQELLNLISKHLNTSIDLLRFRSVCSTWRSSVAPHPDQHRSNFPIVMYDGFFEDKSDFRLSIRPILRLGLLQPNIQTPSHSAADGWLIKIDQGHETFLFDPLARYDIKTLPESFPRRLDLLKYRVSELGNECVIKYTGSNPCDAGIIYAEKVALLRSCSGSGIDSYVLLAIHATGKLAIFKFGERKWTIIDDLPYTYDDVIQFEQKFYAVDNTGRTVVVNVDESSPVVNLIAPPVFGADKKALVESSGELLLIDMYRSIWPEDDLGFHVGIEFFNEFGDYMCEMADQFKVFRLDRREQKWVEVDSLGERMLFLGAHCTFSASASDFSGCKGNCIIFTDQYFYSNSEQDDAMEGSVVGVFDLESGSIESFADSSDYSKMFWPPPSWVSSIMLEAGSNQLRI